MLTIATWNVNSVKSRLPHLLGWLREDKPDIVLLQELKCTDDAFPALEIEDLGYNIATHGQKTYNGVAILSKFPLSDITRGLPGEDGDDHARYIEAVVSIGTRDSAYGNRENDKTSRIPNPQSPIPAAIRVASVYVPNGQEASSEKFPYKLRFLDRLHAHLKTLLSYNEAFVIGGDYNIAPTDADVHNPKLWEGSVLTHDEVRMRFRRILNLGIYDAQPLSSHHRGEARRGASPVWPEQVCPHPNPPPNGEGIYTWWDYRAGAFEQDNGLRIDHLLLSPQAADLLQGYEVKKSLRMLEKPSDHTPVVVILREA